MLLEISLADPANHDFVILEGNERSPTRPVTGFELGVHCA
jgi:hypothetical protein